MRDTSFALEIARKLGQLQAQLQHLPRPSDAEYQAVIHFTQRFAGEVCQELGQLTTTMIANERRAMPMTMQLLQDDDLRTFKEAMSYLKVSRSTLYRLLWSGQLIGHKVGSAWRFKHSDLQACCIRKETSKPARREKEVTCV